jgi:hypothetical protein
MFAVDFALCIIDSLRREMTLPPDILPRLIGGYNIYRNIYSISHAQAIHQSFFCVTIWSYSHVCLGHCCNYYNGAITVIMYMYNGNYFEIRQCCCVVRTLFFSIMMRRFCSI